ncbi:ABC transporter substrate-binding protein [Bradyrhizobium ottawaense]|uniref:ABC transporter substrate-binding protein n=1 Tax=Bradyrhizobium ottawaense TaxID=931866 RepID=UPI0038333DD5
MIFCRSHGTEGSVRLRIIQRTHFKAPWRSLVVALVALSCSAIAEAQTTPISIKLGVLTDMAGPLSDAYGPGSLYAAQLAAEDARKWFPEAKIEIVSGDHQNKPDVGAAIARKWFETDHVDAVFDLVNTGVAIAVQGVARDHKKIDMWVSGARTLAGKYCSPYSYNWSSDSYSLVNNAVSGVLRNGGKKWYFITTDYSGPKEMEEQAVSMIQAAGAQMVGHSLFPLGTNDFASQLLTAQTSGATVFGLASAGADTINAIKQAHEFGLLKGGRQLVVPSMFLNDIDALGLESAQSVVFSGSFYWDLNDETRAWSHRFFEKMRKMPSDTQGGIYTGVSHYLKAVQAARSTDSDAVMMKIREIPINDFHTRDGRVLQNGSVMRQRLVFQVKGPDESKGPWDYLKIIRTLTPDESAPPPVGETGCPFAK